MYRTHLERWGIEKKYKEREMRAIVRKKRNRLGAGKDSDFLVRGNPVDFEDVVRYWKRKGIPLDAINNGRTMSKTPEGVVCITPKPSPTNVPSIRKIRDCVFTRTDDHLDCPIAAHPLSPHELNCHRQSMGISCDGLSPTRGLFEYLDTLQKLCSKVYSLVEYDVCFENDMIPANYQASRAELSWAVTSSVHSASSTDQWNEREIALISIENFCIAIQKLVDIERLLMSARDIFQLLSADFDILTASENLFDDRIIFFVKELQRIIGFIEAMAKNRHRIIIGHRILVLDALLSIDRYDYANPAIQAFLKECE